MKKAQRIAAFLAGILIQPYFPLAAQSRKADAGVVAEAAKVWHKRVAHCGATYYQKDYLGDDVSTRKLIAVTELKDFNWQIEALPLSNADRLNGVEYRGSTFYSISAYRETEPGGDWKPWLNGYVSMARTTLTRINGAWHVEEPYEQLHQEAPTCAEVAELLGPARRLAYQRLKFSRELRDAASQHADLSKIAQLLRSGADPNWRETSESDTALSLALYHPAATEAVRMLLDAKADPNTRNYVGIPVLTLAVYSHNLAVARLLVAKGANPNLPTTGTFKSEHPLLFATNCTPAQEYQNSPEIVSLLLSAGTSNEVQDSARQLAEERLKDARDDNERRLCHEIIAALGGKTNAQTSSIDSKPPILRPAGSLEHYNRAESLFAKGDYNGAMIEYQRALQALGEPRWTEVWSHIGMGKVYDLWGQRPNAQNEYRQAIQTGDTTRGAIEEARKYLETPFRLENLKP